MSDLLNPGNTVSFTVSTVPTSPAGRKTIQRLMRMQPDVRRGLRKLQNLRKDRNVTYIRAGRPWTNRCKATKLTKVELGEQFTLFLTPQILPDIHAVASHLEMKAG